MSENSSVSAPAVLTLFGEHGWRQGHPAAAVAVELRTTCTAQLSAKFTVNGEPMEQARHPHARAAVIHGWTDMDKPLALSLSSQAPPELGLGNDAAAVVSCLGAISMLHDHMIYGQIAGAAFEALSETGALPCPLQAAVPSHGGMMSATPLNGGEPLWTFRSGKEAWQVSDIQPGAFEFVLGYTGKPADVSGMAAKLERICSRNSFARETLRDLGAVSAEGVMALGRGDCAAVGGCMTRSHRLLVNLGMSSPELDRLVKAVAGHSHGAKLAGHGGGGCIIALASNTDAAVSAIERAGGRAIVPKLAHEGVRPED